MSTSIPLKQEVTEQLPWLFEELGFRVVEDHFDPKSFGNSFVTLGSPGLQVRFVRDRGQISAEVCVTLRARKVVESGTRLRTHRGPKY